MADIREIRTEDEDGYGRFSTGILPSHVLKRLIAAGREINAREDFTDAQIQPASIDLRLGPVAYRVRASLHA
jgi:dCTP deaminase